MFVDPMEEGSRNSLEHTRNSINPEPLGPSGASLLRSEHVLYTSEHVLHTEQEEGHDHEEQCTVPKP